MKEIKGIIFVYGNNTKIGFVGDRLDILLERMSVVDPESIRKIIEFIEKIGRILKSLKRKKLKQFQAVPKERPV